MLPIINSKRLALLDYATVYTKIRKDVVSATKELIESGLWDETISKQDRFISMGLWLQKVSKFYNIETPKIFFVDGEEAKKKYIETGGGSYNLELNTIFIYHKVSLISLLHEFRTIYQHHNQTTRLYKKDKMEDARAWSLSLFYLASPDDFDRCLNQATVEVG